MIQNNKRVSPICSKGHKFDSIFVPSSNSDTKTPTCKSITAVSYYINVGFEHIVYGESAFSMTSMALCTLSLQNYSENSCMGAVIVSFVSNSRLVRNKYNLLVCTTQVNRHTDWLARR